MSATEPTFTELLDWVEGRVPEPRRSQLAALAAQDTATAASIEWIESFLAAGRLMPLATPPAEQSARLRRTLDEYFHPWRPEHYSEGALALASGGPATARGTRGAALTPGATTGTDDLVFETEVGRVRVVARLVGREGSAGAEVRIVLDESAIAAFPPQESRVLLATGDRVRRRGIRVSAAEFEVADVPADIDRIWLVHPDRTVRLSPPGGWPTA
jgi:hypothetical protein